MPVESSESTASAAATESNEEGETAPPPGPVKSLDDPRALQILSTEHWSLLSARSLAYNEAFTRGGMFLSFLSMSFVALALVSQAMAFDRQFLAIAAVVLGFDFIIGLTTYGRIIGANSDDLRAVHGMSRIRHGYVQIAPIVEPYFVTGTHDDEAGIMISYGNPPSRFPQALLYGLSTSGGMIGLIVAMVGGVLVGVITLAFGGSGPLAVVLAVIGAFVVFAAQVFLTFGTTERTSASLPALFPTPETERDDR